MNAHTVVPDRRRRGQPIVMLGAVLLLWTMGRTAMWESPFGEIAPIIELPGNFAAASDESPHPAKVAKADVSDRAVQTASTNIRGALSTLLFALPQQYGARGLPSPSQPGRFASHQALWMAAMSYVPVPEEIASLFQPVQNVAPHPAGRTRDNQRQSLDRWSLDSWLFIRQGGQRRMTAGPVPATYGASQAGAVLRYRLAPQSWHKPYAYIRLTSPLSNTAEAEIASGLAARPLKNVPISTHAELRANRSSGKVRARPAAFIVTELPPTELPYQTRLEAYAQAGYVGGDFRTSFVDGQLRLDREVAKFDLGTVRAGAGAWGGAQRGAARLDVGPTASIDIKVGETPARVSMDYRHRVAGDAEPQSGVAITLSTGF